jgi:hypothetical protein
MDNCKKVLTSQTFTDILTQGLKNQVAYVRQHFIEFIVFLVPMLRRLLEDKEIMYCIKEIIICLISILRKVDLTMYGEKIDEVHIASDHRITNYLSKKNIINPTEHDLTISSELEI